MAVSEMQAALIPVDLSDGIIAQVGVVDPGQETVKLGILPCDLAIKVSTHKSQVVATLIQASKPVKARMKYGLTSRGQK